MSRTVHPTFPRDLHLVQYPHPALRQVAAPVTVFDDELIDFCQRLFQVMEDERGVGLAAPQVAVAKRIFITDHTKRKDENGDEQPPSPRVWINPRLENTSGTTVFEEGCLSFPSIYAKVTRHDRFDIVWQDEFGATRRQSLDVSAGDFLGIVVQHELDHLDGKVFVDHLTAPQLLLVRKKMRDLEDDYRKATGSAGAVMRR